MKFSKVVKRWRVKRELSKADAARQLGIPYRTFQDWELGTRTPRGWQRKLLEEKLAQ